MPAEMAAPWIGALSLYYTPHARDAANEDRCGPVKLDHLVTVQTQDVVEVTMNESGEPEKAVVRVPSTSPGLDIVLVLMVPKFAGGWAHAGKVSLVKTVWFNKSTDTHRTLDTSRYVTNF